MTKGNGYFGQYGGRYVPETLVPALNELAEAYEAVKKDPSFWEELEWYWREYSGRPTPLYFARRLTERLGGPKIYLKREDLNHTGAHKINNTLGQILLAKRMGNARLLPKPVPASMGWPVLRLLLCSGWNAWCSWARKMFGGRP